MNKKNKKFALDASKCFCLRVDFISLSLLFSFFFALFLFLSLYNFILIPVIVLSSCGLNLTPLCVCGEEGVRNTSYLIPDFKTKSSFMSAKVLTARRSGGEK